MHVHLSQFENFKKFLSKNILGIDFGTKVIGLATFCPGNAPFPTPYGRVISQDRKSDITEILKIVSLENIELIVIGLPKFLDGKETKMSKIVEKFGKDLSKNLPDMEITYQEETLSTKEAEQRMLNSPRYNFKIDPKQIDAVAASIILEEFICAL